MDGLWVRRSGWMDWIKEVGKAILIWGSRLIDPTLYNPNPMHSCPLPLFY